MLIAVGIDWDGRRQILAVEMANRESRSAWKDFLLGLSERGLQGVELVVADDHAGLGAAIGEVLPEAAWQRCYVHFLRNALDHLPRKAATTACRSCAGSTTGASRRGQADLAAWLAKWSARYPRLAAWAEETIEETLTFFRLPRQHHKHLKSTNMLERLNEEIRRRTYVVRIFPNARAACAGQGPGRRDPRKLDGGQPLHQHGRPEGAQESSALAKPHDQPDGRPTLQNLTHTTFAGPAQTQACAVDQQVNRFSGARRWSWHLQGFGTPAQG